MTTTPPALQWWPGSTSGLTERTCNRDEDGPRYRPRPCAILRDRFFTPELGKRTLPGHAAKRGVSSGVYSRLRTDRTLAPWRITAGVAVAAARCPGAWGAQIAALAGDSAASGGSAATAQCRVMAIDAWGGRSGADSAAPNVRPRRFGTDLEAVSQARTAAVIHIAIIAPVRAIAHELPLNQEPHVP